MNINATIKDMLIAGLNDYTSRNGWSANDEDRWEEIGISIYEAYGISFKPDDIKELIREHISIKLTVELKDEE